MDTGGSLSFSLSLYKYRQKCSSYFSSVSNAVENPPRSTRFKQVFFFQNLLYIFQMVFFCDQYNRRSFGQISRHRCFKSSRIYKNKQREPSGRKKRETDTHKNVCVCVCVDDAIDSTIVMESQTRKKEKSRQSGACAQCYLARTNIQHRSLKSGCVKGFWWSRSRKQKVTFQRDTRDCCGGGVRSFVRWSIAFRS